MKYDEVKEMQEHIFKMTIIGTRLGTLETKIENFFIIKFILNSLLPQYDSFQMNYNSIKNK